MGFSYIFFIYYAVNVSKKVVDLWISKQYFHYHWRLASIKNLRSKCKNIALFCTVKFYFLFWHFFLWWHNYTIKINYFVYLVNILSEVINYSQVCCKTLGIEGHKIYSLFMWQLFDAKIEGQCIFESKILRHCISVQH